MGGKSYKTIEDYIQDMPAEGQGHLRRLYVILKSAAPEAQEAIKWGFPFFIEPRFLFAFSAFQKHFNFTPNAEGLAPFREELASYKTNKGSLQVYYKDPLPEDLIRRIAEHRVQCLKERQDDAFWDPPSAPQG